MSSTSLARESARVGNPGGPATWVLLALVHTYRLVISPVVGPACRFTPSCSAYAEEALRSHGAARGTLLAVRRVLRCHPFHAGGYDPVPPTEPHSGT